MPEFGMRVTPPYEDHSVLPRPPGGPENPTNALYRAALGPVNTAYYLPVFERFDAAGRPGLVWNPAAGLLTLNWMAFRGLWGAALVYLAAAQGLALMVLGLSRHVLAWPLGVELGVLGTVLLLSIALPGLYGNALLHAEIRRRLAAAVTNAHTVREACEALEQQAPTRKRLQVFMSVNALLVFLALALGSFALFRPATGAGPAGLPTAAPMAEPVAVPAAAAPVPEPVPAPVVEPPPPVQRPAPSPAATTEAPPVLAPLPAPRNPAAAEAASVPPPAAAPTPRTSERPAPPAPDPAPRALPRSAEPPGPAPAEAPPNRPAASPAPHSINVGLFAEEANAVKVHAQLTEAGLPATMQTVEGTRGPRTRVRAGPFPDRPSAEAAAQRIRSLGLEAQVFRQ